MRTDLAGMIVPIITPFDAQDKFSPCALKVIIDHLIINGVSAIFSPGSVGEFYALDEAELMEIIRTTVEIVNGRVPVIAGTGTIDTRRSVMFSRYAEQAGANAVSILMPFYIQPNDEEIFEHYGAILKAVNIPVLGYNNPGRSGGVTISPQLARRLYDAYPNFAGLKDSSGNIGLLKEFKRICPPDFALFNGLDSIIFDAMLNEARGGVCGLANIAPRMMVDIYELTCVGKLADARCLQQKIARLRDAYALGTFPVVVKEAMNLMGLPAGNTRAPVGPLSPASREKLRQVLVELELISEKMISA